MLEAPIPWIGLAALAAMFLLPHVDRLFQGPRTIKHWPRRHVCGDCGGAWTDDHTCPVEMGTNTMPLKGELRRLPPTRAGRRLDNRDGG